MKKKRRRMLPDWRPFERDQAVYLVLKHGLTAENAAIYLGRPGRGRELQKYVDTRVHSMHAGTQSTKEEMTIQCIEVAGNEIDVAGYGNTVAENVTDLAGNLLAPPPPISPPSDRDHPHSWGPAILIAIALIVAALIHVAAGIGLF